MGATMTNRCRFAECNGIPWYGRGGSGRRAEYCAQHAGTGMVKVGREWCAHQGCTKPALYGEDDSSTKGHSAPTTPRLEWSTSATGGVPTKAAPRGRHSAWTLVEKRPSSVSGVPSLEW